MILKFEKLMSYMKKYKRKEIDIELMKEIEQLKNILFNSINQNLYNLYQEHILNDEIDMETLDNLYNFDVLNLLISSENKEQLRKIKIILENKKDLDEMEMSDLLDKLFNSKSEEE